MKICPYCKTQFDAMSAPTFANHVGWCIENPKREERINRLDTMRSKICNESRQDSSESIKQAHRDGRYKQSYENRKGVKRGPMSDETKLKLSEARIKYLAENPDNHPWKRTKLF